MVTRAFQMAQRDSADGPPSGQGETPSPLGVRRSLLDQQIPDAIDAAAASCARLPHTHTLIGERYTQYLRRRA